jgi:hypothetical protein
MSRVYHYQRKFATPRRCPRHRETPAAVTRRGAPRGQHSQRGRNVSEYRHCPVLCRFSDAGMPSLSMRSGDPYRDAAPLDHLVGAAEQREREVPPRDFALLRHITSLVFVDCM